MPHTFPQFMHHGAADGVTGSCHRYMASEEFHLLVDCGLFQGQEARNSGPAGQQIDFDLACVRALVVTHVHIDHIGRLPYLMAAGFKGPVLCSAPSAKLLPLVIEDALKMGFTRDRKTIERFLAEVNDHLLPLAYATWYPLRNTPLLQLKLRLQRAGHILGSAYVELDLRWRESETDVWRSHHTVFSGDLGAPHAPLLPAPKSPQWADTLIIESTYGNRVHENRATRRQRLKALVEKALADGGTVLIPAFSIGRTQELLYEFEGILHELNVVMPDTISPSAGSVGNPCGSSQKQSTRSSDDPSGLWKSITIVVDSPLAAKFTEVYRGLKPYWDEEAMKRVRSGRHPLDFDSLLTVDSHEDHLRLVQYLADTHRPAIVIAASGMAAGGRIVNYLKAMLGDPRHNVLFVGYQVPGTPGHEIMKGSNGLASVELDGERFEIRAGVDYVGGYSAHADQQNLLSFVRGMRQWPGEIRVVHGNEEARSALKRALKALAEEYGRTMNIVLPQRS